MGERQAPISSKRKQTSGPLGQQRVGAAHGDDDDQRRQETGADDGAGRVVEDLNQWHPGGREGCVVDVADAEADADQEDEARDGAQVDGHDDRFGRFRAGVFHLFGHVRGGVEAVAVVL